MFCQPRLDAAGLIRALESFHPVSRWRWPVPCDAWRAEGQNICIEQIEQLQEIEGVAGVHIMAIEWEAAIRPIVERAGLFPRPQV